MLENVIKTVKEINGNTCINKIRSMIEIYVPEEDYKHRVCNGQDLNCPNYMPVQRTEVPLNYARFKQ